MHNRTPSESKLVKDGIKSIFLRPNATPIDQVIIENSKIHYRKRLIRFLVKGGADGAQIVQHLKLVDTKKVDY